MTASLRSHALALLAAPALLLPTGCSEMAVGEDPDRVLTVGTDVAEGWLWVGGSPDGCGLAQDHDDGISTSFTTENEALLVEVRTGGVLEVEDCGALVPVSELPRTTTSRQVDGDGVWLVGPHFAPGGVYGGEPAADSPRDEHLPAACRWSTHTSIAAYDDHVGFPDREGRLRITPTTRVVETDGDCRWTRLR